MLRQHAAPIGLGLFFAIGGCSGSGGNGDIGGRGGLGESADGAAGFGGSTGDTGRFSGDGGRTWTYCDTGDAGSSDGFNAPGVLIVTQ
jgi:hypothetical protein